MSGAQRSLLGGPMFDSLTAPVELVFRFGPFRVSPRTRLLLKGDKPVQLGSRALDILLALLEHPGELVSNETLVARVWPSTVVVPSNLTVQVTALRRALHDGRNDNRYFLNVPGRGYQFVAPVVIADEPISGVPSADAPRSESDFAAYVMQRLGMRASSAESAPLLPDAWARLERRHASAEPGSPAKAAEDTREHDRGTRLLLDDRTLAALVVHKGISALVQTLISHEPANLEPAEANGDGAI